MIFKHTLSIYQVLGTVLTNSNVCMHYFCDLLEANYLLNAEPEAGVS